MSGSLKELAAALRASPESDTLAVLGQLLDALPIGVLVTDTSGDLTCRYSNETLEEWVPRARRPVFGRRLVDLWEQAEASGVLTTVRQSIESGQPQRRRAIDAAGLLGREVSPAGRRRLWDCEAHPLRDAVGRLTGVLVAIMDVTEQGVPGPASAPDDRRRRPRPGGHVHGIVPMFGTRRAGAEKSSQLTEREWEIAELVALGLTNSRIAHRIHRSPATVASHVASVLDKLGFTSRAQIAAWVVGQHIRRTNWD